MDSPARIKRRLARKELRKAASSRPCGECTACCTLRHVVTLAKPSGVPCLHEVPGIGCASYKERPIECRDFECLWRAGLLGPEHRPDKLGVMFSVRPMLLGRYGEHVIVAEPLELGGLDTPEAMTVIQGLAHQGQLVLLLARDLEGNERRRMAGPPEKVQRAQEFRAALRNESQVSSAARLGVKRFLVADISAGRAWRHLCG